MGKLVLSTLMSGMALNVISNSPFSLVVLSPWVISCGSLLNHGRRQKYQCGYCTFRCTRYTTLASVILLPAYAKAVPFTVTESLTIKVSVMGLNLVSNLGRLYSSTDK